MKVHCIASGEYMPGAADRNRLDFGALATKALDVKRRVVGRGVGA